jgi:hypothetical protein
MDEKKLTAIIAMPLYILSEARRRFGPEFEVGRDFFVTSEDMEIIYRMVVDSYLISEDNKLKTVSEFVRETHELWCASKMFIRERKEVAYASYFIRKPRGEDDRLEPLMEHLEWDLTPRTADYLGKRLPPTNRPASLPNLQNMTPAAAEEFERVLDSIDHREFAIRVYASLAN